MVDEWNTTMKWCLRNSDEEIANYRTLMHLLITEDNSRDNITSPLHVAVLGNNSTIIKCLIAHNLPLNANDRNGATPLHWACSCGNEMAIKLLLQSGADYSRLDFDGNNILHYAVEQGHYDIVKFIISLKIINLEEQNNDGQTVLHIACKNEEVQIMKLLLAQEVSIESSLLSVIEQNSFLILRILVKYGNLSFVYYNGKRKNPLHFAVNHNRTRISKILLKYYPWLSICVDKHGRCPKYYINSTTKPQLFLLLTNGISY